MFYLRSFTMAEAPHFSVLGFEELVTETTNKWKDDTENYERELLELVNVYLTENFDDSIALYDLDTLRKAFNLMELREQSRGLGERLTNEITKKLIYRLVRHLIQSHRLKIINKQKFNLGLWKLGLTYEYEGAESKRDVDATAALLIISALVVVSFMWAVKELNKK